MVNFLHSYFRQSCQMECVRNPRLFIVALCGSHLLSLYHFGVAFSSKSHVQSCGWSHWRRHRTPSRRYSTTKQSRMSVVYWFFYLVSPRHHTSGFRLNIPRLNLLSSPEKRQPGKAPNYSVNWTLGVPNDQLEIVDAMKGKEQVPNWC